MCEYLELPQLWYLYSWCGLDIDTNYECSFWMLTKCVDCCGVLIGVVRGGEDRVIWIFKCTVSVHEKDLSIVIVNWAVGICMIQV